MSWNIDDMAITHLIILYRFISNSLSFEAQQSQKMRLSGGPGIRDIWPKDPGTRKYYPDYTCDQDL